MKILLTSAILALTAVSPAFSQQEGLVPTQALVREDGNGSSVLLTPSNVSLKVDNKQEQITSLAQVVPTGAQVALLIDDGLRTSFGRNLSDIESFIANLPSGTEILIGYMQNGRVLVAQPFTTDHATAAKNLRIPFGQAGISASPYFCLSDFVKNWPSEAAESSSNPEAIRPLNAGRGGTHKARFVLMMTNGVDPYNGSVSPLNQSSPYVDSAIRDAQRASVPVYSIYYTDAGIRGGAASFSGQGYLSQLADATGGTAYFQGTWNPVSLTPFFKQFQKAISETYIATFPASGRDLVRLKLTTALPKVKLRHADVVPPGAQLAD